MENIQLGIHNLTYEDVTNPHILLDIIYPNMYKNYYWSDDFSAQYYIAQAKAGFLAVTDTYEDEELLLPEIQFSYALLDFKDLHISKKLNRLFSKKCLKLEITQDLDEVVEKINASHKNCWLTPRYLNMLKSTQDLDDNFQIISVAIRENDMLIAGEVGYIIGKTYTSLSGFSSREKEYHNYGTAQLILLAQYLEANGFEFWNLGQAYMTYKLDLGAKIYERESFLKRWFEATGNYISVNICEF
jgi:Leu/Phe-tRNA-protein transferase